MDCHSSSEEENTSSSERILIKKINELKRIKEVIEKSKPTRSQCCHQKKKKKTDDECKHSDLWFPVISPRSFSLRYMSFETPETKQKKKLERKIEIMQRLLNEERKRRKQKINKKIDNKKITVKSLPPSDILTPWRRKSLGNITEKSVSHIFFNTSSISLSDDDDENLKVSSTGRITQPQGEQTETTREISNEQIQAIEGKSDSIKENIITDREITSAATEIEVRTPPLPHSLVKELMENFQIWFTKHDPELTCELPIDSFLTSNPPEIIFQFPMDKPDQVYKRKLTVTNVGSTSVYCGYENILVKSDMVNYKLTAKPNDIQLLRPSFSLSIELQFCPIRNQKNLIEGKVIFTTRRGEIKGQYSVPIKCQPMEDKKEQENKETIIRFKKVKYWEKSLTKTVTLKNPSDKKCYIYLSRILDTKKGHKPKVKNKSPIDEENTNLNDFEHSELIATMDSILEEILNNVFEPILLIPQYFTEVPPSGNALISVKFRPYIIANEDFIIKKYEARTKLKSGKIIDIHDFDVIQATAEPSEYVSCTEKKVTQLDVTETQDNKMKKKNRKGNLIRTKVETWNKMKNENKKKSLDKNNASKEKDETPWKWTNTVY